MFHGFSKLYSAFYGTRIEEKNARLKTENMKDDFHAKFKEFRPFSVILHANSLLK